jgi:hypothetical protein
MPSAPPRRRAGQRLQCTVCTRGFMKKEHLQVGYSRRSQSNLVTNVREQRHERSRQTTMMYARDNADIQ